jgi:hypothetical protein
MSSPVLREYIPASWFHARGIYKVLARLTPRLPDVSGNLFLTFTVNPLLYASPANAFEHARDRLRRVFYRLRRGVSWEGKTYVIDAPYAIKVEFHQNGWAHFHVIFRTRRFLPAALLNHLWGLGRTNVQRISNDKFRYLLKYVTKGGGLPDWVLGRSRLRVFQASRGFYAQSIEAKEPAGPSKAQPIKRASTTLGDRLQTWLRSALVEEDGHFRVYFLRAPFCVLAADLIFPAAMERRYLGGGRFLISDISQLETWIN